MFKSIGQLELLGFTLGFVASCNPTRDAAGHCANQDGDAFCAEKYAGERTFCARGIEGCELEQLDGCVVSRPLEDACYSPCGGGKSLDEDPECDSVADGSSSSDSVGETEVTTEPTGGPTTAGSMSASGTEGSSSTTSSGCTLSAECPDAMSPICVDMACVPCSSDDECLAKSPGAPACNEDGQCVTCTPTNASACTDTTPVCNAVNECEGCEFHEQCTGTACDIATGACFAEDCVVEVDGDGGADYTDIQDAIVDGCVIIVHELDGGVSYQDSLEIDGVSVAMLAADGEDPIVVGLAGTPSLNIVNGGFAYVQALTFSQNTAEAVAADAATIYLDRSVVIGNDGGGIVLTNDAHGYVRTSIIGGNGTGAGPSRGLTVNGSTLDVLYSTIARNDADTADDSLSCAGGSTVTVRNSILVGRDDPSVMCAGATIEDSALDQTFGTNTDVGAIQNTWFDNVAGNVFTLSAAGGAVFGDVAEWAEGDPATDINGELRPTQPGPDVAGADIP